MRKAEDFYRVYFGLIVRRISFLCSVEQKNVISVSVFAYESFVIRVSAKNTHFLGKQKHVHCIHVVACSFVKIMYTIIIFMFIVIAFLHFAARLQKNKLSLSNCDAQYTYKALLNTQQLHGKDLDRRRKKTSAKLRISNFSMKRKQESERTKKGKMCIQPSAAIRQKYWLTIKFCAGELRTLISYCVWWWLAGELLTARS